MIHINDQDHIADEPEIQKLFDQESWGSMINALHMEFSDKTYVPKTSERIEEPSDPNVVTQGKAGGAPKAASRKKRAASNDAADAPPPRPKRRASAKT